MNDRFPCLVFEPTQQDTRTTIVLFHGGSSNNESLRPLAPYFAHFRLILPQAPVEVGSGTFDWFRFANEQLTLDHNSMAKSIEIISPFVDKLRAETEGNLVIAGISQGAIFASELFFRSQGQFDGLMMLSGFLSTEAEHLYDGKRAFVGHGSKDPLVSIDRAIRSVEKLRKSGLNVEFKTYEMGHDISEEELSDAVSWLNHF